MNTSKFSFLHRRPFWAVVCTLSIIIYLWLYDWRLLNPFRDFSDIIDTLNYTFGGALWGALGLKLGGLAGGYAISILYLVFLIYLLVKTFEKKVVSIKYPLLFLIVPLFGFLFLVSVYGY